jgi:FAD/FMN-containing dehydrogenase
MWKSRRRIQKEMTVLGWRAPVSLDPRISPKDVKDLMLAVRGKVVQPSDATYHADRQLSDFAYQQFPLLIVYCEVFSDVRHCLNFARKHGLQVALRSGGHSTAGLSINDGLVIDLRHMNYVVVDAAARPKRAIVGPGANFGHLNAMLDEYRLHLPGGACQDVCVAGYMQGGGYGFTSRQFGMNCDNVLEALVMLADGRIVVASPTKNSDLFWALRGGTGGNFGVLLQVSYRLHELGKVWGFGIQWPLEGKRAASRAAKVLAELQFSYMRKGASRQLGYQAFLGWQGREPYLMMRGIFIGTRAAGRKALRPLLAVSAGKYTISRIASFYELDGFLLDKAPGIPEVPDLAREEKESGYIDRPLRPADWRAIIDKFRTTPNQSSLFAIEPYGGAINAISAGDNAFVHRNVDMNVYFDVFWMDDAQRTQAVAFLDDFMAFMKRYFNGASYQNYPRLTQTDYRERYWGDWFETLLAVKQKYDPQNFFRSAQGIAPDRGNRRARPKHRLAALGDPIAYCHP